MPEKKFMFHINEKLLTELKEKAKEEGMTIKFALHEAINLWLDEKVKQDEAAKIAGTGKYRILRGLKKEKIRK